MLLKYEPRHEKTCFHGFRTGLIKPGCIATGDGWMLVISDFRSKGIVFCSENKGADRVRYYHANDP